jgi:RNA polymerase sigma factor (sigma-70 family)
MQSKTDTELLREYARHGSEAAFGEIVRRYADFVYSAALRQVFDSELARDVAQVVFVDLARKAAALRPDTLLIGWLCRGARLAALDQLRRQQRRLQRERQAMELAEPSSEPPSDWSAIRPALDEALARLAEEDRHALLLRFFKNESLATVGATLGVSEDAAQKRVSRALGKLRDFLAERGIHTTAAALSIALAANAVQAAPAGFVAALTAGALAQAAAAPASITLLNLLASHHMKTAILSLILAGGVAALTVQQVRTQRQLRDAQSTIQSQSESVQALQGAQEQLATQSNELQQLRAQQQEVAQLRSEVARLHRAAAAVPKAAPTQTVSATSAPVTNAPAPSVGLAAKFVLLPAADVKLLNIAWSRTADGTATALLTQDQLQTLNQALDGATDVKVLGSPRIFTSPGAEAKLFAGPKVSGGHSLAVSGAAGGASFASAPTVTTITGGGGPGAEGSPGLSLSVLPALTPDASAFDLQLSAGFSQWADRSPQQDGSQKEVQSTAARTHLLVPAGKTVLLAKEVPNEGWTEADNTVPGPKSLLVFITPSLVQTSSRLVNVIRVGGGGGSQSSSTEK